MRSDPPRWLHLTAKSCNPKHTSYCRLYFPKQKKSVREVSNSLSPTDFLFPISNS